MIKRIFFKISLLICLGFAALPASAQQVNTLYFMEIVPFRNNFNPAFQPLSNFYLGLPILGYSQFGIVNNSISIKDFAYKINGNSSYFLNELGDKDKFYNTLKSNTLFQANAQFNLISFGFRQGDGYWSFGLTEKVDAYVTVPKDAAKIILYTTPDINGNSYNLKSLGSDVSAYTEAAFGYSRKLNEKFTVGGKLKFLYGTFNSSVSNTNLDMTADIDQWTLKGKSIVNYASSDTLKNIGNGSAKVSNLLKPAGLGGGIDLGATFKPIDRLTLSASLLDLGFIRWSRNAVSITNTVDYTYVGLVNFTGANLHDDFSNVMDSIAKAFASASTLTAQTKSYTTYLSPKLNIGAEYSFYDNKLSVGLLSRTTKYHRNFAEELTASVNGRPVDWFNMSASYSVMNGRMSTIGAGLGVRTGVVNWVLAADYMPFNYAKVSSANLILPYNSKGVNFSFGINLVLGNNKDSDHDGVIDKKDQCPDTPLGVKVDKKGCPIDSDGDGVPDYLDKCPNTPKEAYGKIDKKGCPLDNDSDGVLDYKDKCPNTPKASIGFVDSLGCSIDTDKDGVFDYKDKCPGTPAGVKVDSIGCPLDTDKDGVFDNKDKCPNTPPRVKVDSVGCPVDTDLDGVADYLDKCPDTPAAERAFVDKDGCTIKKQSATAVDTDGDGVPDNIDQCPKVPGPASNKGCPVVKKEIQNLFHKALQGIQFESGKYVIKPISYKILNQIAGVLIANPTYIVEVRGHTDNVGKPATNMALSANRAKAVMKYLIGKKVPAHRISANGYGDTLPVASNKTVAGKSINRRVEFIVTFEEITFE